MNAKYEYFEERIQKTFEQHRFKQLRCIVPHEVKPTGTLDFTSYDFLGLTLHDFVKKQSIKAVLRWGAGSTASRRINSHIEYQHTLERKLGGALGFEETLFFSSTMQVHSAIFPTIINKQTYVFIDRFASPFLYQAIEPLTPKIIRIEHNNVHDIVRHLQKYNDIPTHQKIILTESLFTTSGDYAPLKDLIELAHKYRTLLYVDDSNTMGVKGHNGLGYCAYRQGIDFVIGSFGKAAGSFGAYVAFPSILKDFVCSMNLSIAALPPLPPAVLGGVDASLTLIPDMHHERTRIEELAEYTRNALFTLGLEYGASSSHIIPIFFDSDSSKNQMGDYLEEHSIYVLRSQKKNNEQPSLRILLSIGHTKEDIDTLCSTLSQGLKELSILQPTLATSYVT